jgi:endogenous inhibitor of DNA gyrase (YacG/DUF329 family)
MSVTIDCPICGHKTEFSPANRWRPFCSERCKQIDLGVWASEGYAIPGESLDPDAESDGLGPAATQRPTGRREN